MLLHLRPHSLQPLPGMRRIFQEAAGSAVHLVKFGRFTADLLAFAAADGCVYVAGATEEQGGVLQVHEAEQLCLRTRSPASIVILRPV